MRSRLGRLVLAALAVALVAAACSTDGDDSTAADAAADETTTTEAATTEASATEEADADAPAGGATTFVEGTELESGTDTLDPGTYSTDVLGTPLSVDLPEGFEAEIVETGMVLLSAEDRTTDTTETLIFYRPSGLANVIEAVEGPADPTGALTSDAGDVEAWASATGEVDIVDSGEVDVAGGTAERTTFALQADGTAGLPGGCGPTEDDRCFMFTSTGAPSLPFIIARTTELYRTWVIDQGDLPPLMILAIANESFPDWLDTVGDDVVASTGLGEPADRPEDTTTNADGVLTQQFAAIPEGLWRIESLGTSFEVTFTDEWWTQPNGDGWAVLTHPDSRGPGDRDVVFIRPTVLSDPANPAAAIDDQPDWPVTDIEGWLDGLPEGIVAADATSVTLGGLEGITFDVELEEGLECDPASCVAFVGNGEVSGAGFEHNHRYRVFWLDQGDLEPIAIVVGAHPNDADSWYDTADGLLETVVFGDAAPHPVAG